MAKLRRKRAKRLVLDVGSSAIRLCELAETKAGYQLTRYFQREVLVDPLLDEDAKRKLRVDALKKLLKDARARGRRTVVGVPGRSVFTRTRTLPPVPEYKVTQIVRYEIQQQIPFALDQIALDYQILTRTEAGGYDVMMAAIKVDVVEKHLDILREAKCRIDVVDVCPLAAYNWLKHTGEFGAEGECVALLDLGASTTDIIIERGSQFRFTRPLNLAGDDITSAIRDAFGLNFADAEKLKRERGFAPTGDPQRDGKLGETIGGVLLRLITEITRSFAYFRSLPGGGTVDRIVVTGGGACLRNIVPYFQRQFGIEVRIARPTAGLAIAPAAQEANEHPEQTAVALGMALRTCQTVPIEINLIPPAVLEAARRREQAFYWILSFVTLALIAASIVPARANKDKVVRERIETLKGYVRYYDPALVDNPTGRSVLEEDLSIAKQNVDYRRNQLTSLSKAQGGARFWLKDLKLLNALRPEGGKVWFSSIETTVLMPGSPPGQTRAVAQQDAVSSTGFPSLAAGVRTVERGRGNPVASSANAPQVAAPPMANGYRILGYAKDPDVLTQFITTLREHPRFKYGVHFNEAHVEKVYITDLDDASVGMRGGGGASSAGMTGRSPDRAPLSGQTWDTLVFFRVDVQFGPNPAAPAPAPGATGAPKMAFPAPKAVPAPDTLSEPNRPKLFGGRNK